MSNTAIYLRFINLTYAVTSEWESAGIGDRLVLVVPQMFRHLGFEGTFDQSLGQLLEKPVFSDKVFRLFVIRQQAVYQFVVYGHFSSFEDHGSFLPLNRLHKI